MSTNVFQSDPRGTNEAIKHLDDSYDSSVYAKTEAENLTNLQTESKWGTQPGPQAFMIAYRNKLSELTDRLADVRNRIDGLRAGVQATVKAANDADETSAQDFNQKQAFDQASATQYGYDKTVDQIQQTSGAKPSTGNGNTPGY